MTPTDHVGRGLSRLIEKFKRQPNVVGLVTALLQEVQELSDAIYLAYVNRQLDNAFGVGLDQWGKVLKLARGGAGDDAYRVRLRVQLLILKGSGTAPELIKIFQMLAPPPRTVTWIPRYPAGQEILISGDPSPDGEDLSSILRSARAAGIGSQLRWSGALLTQTFTTQGGGGLGATTLVSPAGTGGVLGRAKES